MWRMLSFYHRVHCWDLNWGMRRRRWGSAAELWAGQATSSPVNWCAGGSREKEQCSPGWAQCSTGWGKKQRAGLKITIKTTPWVFLPVRSPQQKSHWPQPPGQGFILRVIYTVIPKNTDACSPRVETHWNLSCIDTALRTPDTNCSVCGVPCVDPYDCVVCYGVYNVFVTPTQVLLCSRCQSSFIVSFSRFMHSSKGAQRVGLFMARFSLKPLLYLGKKSWN